jgi:hypothetical protein
MKFTVARASAACAELHWGSGSLDCSSWRFEVGVCSLSEMCSMPVSGISKGCRPTAALQMLVLCWRR